LYPPKRPQLSDLDVREVERLVRALGNPDHRKRDLLAVKRIEHIQKLYLAAVALVYSIDTGSNTEVAFTIDGKLSQDHELTYAKMGGPKKQGIETGIKDSICSREFSRDIKTELGVSEERLKETEQTALSAGQTIEKLERALGASNDAAEQEWLRQRIDEQKQVRLKAETELHASPVRNL